MTGLTKLTTENELPTEFKLVSDKLTVLLTELELTERLTVEGSELIECLTDELTVLLTVNGLDLTELFTEFELTWLLGLDLTTGKFKLT